jgi:hypothetical protein
MQNYRGKNIIFKKFKGVFVKFHELGIFRNFWNYFPEENSMEKVHGTVDRVHGAGSPVHNIVNQYQPLNPC